MQCAINYQMMTVGESLPNFLGVTDRRTHVERAADEKYREAGSGDVCETLRRDQDCPRHHRHPDAADQLRLRADSLWPLVRSACGAPVKRPKNSPSYNSSPNQRSAGRRREAPKRIRPAQNHLWTWHTGAPAGMPLHQTSWP